MPAVNPALPRALAVAARHHSLITAAQCRSVGLSRAAVKRLVDRGVWTREAPGLYRVAGAPRTWRGRALAIALTAGDGALVSHRSAAHLWGLQGFAPPGRIDVTVPRHAGPAPRSGTIVHESRAMHLADARTRWGVPVTGPARTFLDVAGQAGELLTTLRALDEVRRLGLATWAELWEALLVHARSGRPGIALARQALRIRHGKRVPDTEFARLFLHVVALAGLEEPASEVEVTACGQRYRLDCAYLAQRIDIELDGNDHLRPEVYDTDRERDFHLELDGWLVLRFSWRRFSQSPDEVIGAVRAALRSRAVR